MDQTRGRGATQNKTSHRFNLPAREADGDWLDALEAIDGIAPRLRTTVTVERPRTIITRNTSPDIGFSQSINAYRGCEHLVNYTAQTSSGRDDPSGLKSHHG